MSNSVNPILLRPALRTVLATDPVLLKMEQFLSWLQSGHRAVSFFPLVAVNGICKATQECASDTEFVTQGALGDFSFSSGDMEGTLYLGL